MFRIPVLVLTFALTAAAEQRQTAFEAYSVIPREAALHLARIAACEGSSQPERWHFIVHEPQSENGLRDYVVADGRVASVNSASQFTEEVHVDNILALHSVHIDSAYVAQMAAQYAASNRMPIASMNYELHKDSMKRPVWKVTCLNPSNRTLGWLLIDASDGTVTAQNGFAIAPATRDNTTGEPISSDQDLGVPTFGLPQIPPAAASDESIATTQNSASPTAGPSGTPPRVAAFTPPDDPYPNARGGGFHPPAPTTQPDQDSRPPARHPRNVEVRRAEAVTREPPPQRRKFEIRLFRPGKKLFDFSDND